MLRLEGIAGVCTSFQICREALPWGWDCVFSSQWPFPSPPGIALPNKRDHVILCLGPCLLGNPGEDSGIRSDPGQQPLMVGF